MDYIKHNSWLLSVNILGKPPPSLTWWRGSLIDDHLVVTSSLLSERAGGDPFRKGLMAEICVKRPTTYPSGSRCHWI
ncbi:hypothetical protein TNCT_378841 [Trichonephila clavata]|uniref:Uncharacterized protein n=1 Tax=Trichonephila clavata TaxID=2740835 RepID=A0A8X6J3B1_TRICU|nr:hypothetical protein TNCT_378841 [Trichonephila clavata]